MPAGDTVRRLLSNLGLTRQGSVERSSVAVDVQRVGSLPLLYLAGELDHHAAAQLRPVVQKVLDQESGGETPEEAMPESGASQPYEQIPQPFARGMLLDMSELDYIDSGGLALLFDIARAFDDEGLGACLGILNPTSQVNRLLEISGLGGIRAVTVVQDARATRRPPATPSGAESAPPGSDG